MKLRTIALLIVFLSCCAAQASGHLSDPAEVVREQAGRIVNELNVREAEFRENPELLEEVVRRDLLPVLDMDYSARLILGRDE